MTTGAMTNPALPQGRDAGECRSRVRRTVARRPWLRLLLAAGFALSSVTAAQGQASTQGQAQPGAVSAVAGPGAITARTGMQRVDAVEAELVADVARAAPGQPFRLGLRLKHDAQWHTYWRNPGDSGLPTRFEPVGPAGASYGDITWPAPQRLAIGGLANYGYEGEVVLSRQVTLPAATEAQTVRFGVMAQWLACKDVCIPGEAALALELPVAASTAPASAGSRGLFDESAAKAPDPRAPRQAGWWQTGNLAYLMLPPGTAAARAEFFPYFEGRVRPAAPQTLVQMAADAGGTGGAGNGGGAGATGAAAVAGAGSTKGVVGAAGVAGAAEGAGGTDASGSAADAAGSAALAATPRLALRLEMLPPAQPEAGGGGMAAGSSLPSPSALPEPAAGLLLLDGKPVEVSLERHSAEPVPVRTLSVAEVAAPAPAATGGLLGRLRGTASLPTSPAVPAGVARAFPASNLGAASQSLAIALVAAFAGGLILNLMPCVFPVIGLKVLSFSHAAGGNARLARLHSLAFSGGVVLSFLVLALVLLGLRSAGEAAGWGFQMQSPVFVGAMALLFVLIALNLSGVFEAGVSMTRLPAGLPLAQGSPDSSRDGLWRSFGTGALAVLIATPCTAPFMGSAVGYTITSTGLETLMVFGALGVGMAVPYLVLGFAPALLRRLPRPGPWLPVFKQLLAFPMLATAAWLAWVITLQAGAGGLLRLLMAAVLVAFGAWLYGRAQVARASGRTRWVALSFASIAGLLTVWHLVQIGRGGPVDDSRVQAAVDVAPAVPGQARPGGRPAPGPLADALRRSGGDDRGLSGATSNGGAGASLGGLGSVGSVGSVGTERGAPVPSSSWASWSSQKVSEALVSGRPVVVDFTAAWCISCQVNKKLVLEREVVRNAFDAKGVVLLRADWTSRDPAITAELARFGRNGVPLYLVYVSADEPPLMLPELLTVDIVLGALAEARQRAGPG